MIKLTIYLTMIKLLLYCTQFKSQFRQKFVEIKYIF